MLLYVYTQHRRLSRAARRGADCAFRSKFIHRGVAQMPSSRFATYQAVNRRYSVAGV